MMLSQKPNRNYLLSEMKNTNSYFLMKFIVIWHKFFESSLTIENVWDHTVPNNTNNTSLEKHSQVLLISFRAVVYIPNLSTPTL